MAALYRALAQFPEACGQFFGFRSFSVRVTVIDAVSQRPIARMRELMRLTCVGGTTNLFRFTFGGWLFAYGPDPRWFEEGHVFAHESVRMEDHETSAE
ncbi:MAG: hypothetical protein ACSLE8_12750 [Rhodococcus sp. (in: high G+C Gram-positive bacteria)]